MADATEAPPASTSSVRTPSEFLSSIKGKSVMVKLNTGVDYKGMMDVYMRLSSSLEAARVYLHPI